MIIINNHFITNTHFIIILTCWQLNIEENFQYSFKKGDTIGFSWKTLNVIPFVHTSDDETCGDKIQQPVKGKLFKLAAKEFSKNVYFFQALYNPVDLFHA